MMELLWYSYTFSGRGEHETSLLEPLPPGETLYLTKKPPDTTRIIPAFSARRRNPFDRHAARPPGGRHKPPPQPPGRIFRELPALARLRRRHQAIGGPPALHGHPLRVANHRNRTQRKPTSKRGCPS